MMSTCPSLICPTTAQIFVDPISSPTTAASFLPTSASPPFEPVFVRGLFNDDPVWITAIDGDRRDFSLLKIGPHHGHTLQLLAKIVPSHVNPHPSCLRETLNTEDLFEMDL